MSQALLGACELGKNEAVRLACLGLPGYISEYCVTLPSDRQAACAGAQQLLVAQLGLPPSEPIKLLQEPWVLGSVIVLLLLFFSLLANRTKLTGMSQLPGQCLRLPLVFSLFSRKKWSRGSADELDAKDGN